MAVSHPAYQPDFSIAMIAGEMDASLGDGSDLVTGFELAFNSPLLQPMKHRIRQQISHVTYTRNSQRISTLEANPHYLVRVAPNLELGFGPGVALVDVGRINKERVLGLQLGLSAHYRYQELFVGAELRHQLTGSTTIGGRSVDADNTRLMVKIGFWLN